MALPSLNSKQQGVTYLILLFLLATLSVGLTVVGESWATRSQREKEAQLLTVGAAYRAAIGRYYDSSPGPQKGYPATLEDLLTDPRVPFPRRHLRQLYPDPITGRADWMLIRASDGGIIGVASSSEAAPIKRAGFELPHAMFETLATQHGDKLSYRHWEFNHPH